MMLGFRRLYVSGSHKRQHLEQSIEHQQIGYLSESEVQLADYLLSEEYRDQRRWPRRTVKIAVNFLLVGILVGLLWVALQYQASNQ